MPGSLLEAAALHAAIDASPNLDEVFDRAELLRLHTLTDNRYADVRTLAEKQRQNAFWLRRIERIGRWRLIRSAGRAPTELDAMQAGFDAVRNPRYSTMRN